MDQHLKELFREVRESGAMKGMIARIRELKEQEAKKQEQEERNEQK